jgi:hypothetical protein
MTSRDPYGQPAYYGYAAPSPQQPTNQYNAPAAAPPAGYPTTYGYGTPTTYRYGTPAPPLQGYGGGYPTTAQVKEKRGHGTGTGLAVGAAAGLLGGLVIAEGVEALSNHDQAQLLWRM